MENKTGATEQGARVVIGNGENTKVFQDLWIDQQPARRAKMVRWNRENSRYHPSPQPESSRFADKSRKIMESGSIEPNLPRERSAQNHEDSNLRT